MFVKTSKNETAEFPRLHFFLGIYEQQTIHEISANNYRQFY